MFRRRGSFSSGWPAVVAEGGSVERVQGVSGEEKKWRQRVRTMRGGGTAVPQGGAASPGARTAAAVKRRRGEAAPLFSREGRKTMEIRVVLQKGKRLGG